MLNNNNKPESKIINELFRVPQNSFTQHLNLPDNDRIIFSGKFGIGKSTFLNHFFTENENYAAIHLYPVNYSVASNRDIFKYLKYDIIYEMMLPGTEYNIEYGEDFTNSWVFQSVIQKQITEIASGFISVMSTLGKDAKEISLALAGWKLFDTAAKKIKEKTKELNENAFEANVLGKYMDNFKTDDGGLYEFGYETELIQRVIARTKEKGKETVLVIDDLDRLDPEHIFRILNVFAAHFDVKNAKLGNNKFGFDKIILVCDIENIRSIYQHKYGITVDFNGYIDKFYSHRVYEFWNRTEVDYTMTAALNQTKWQLREGEIYYVNAILNYYFLKDLLSELIVQNVLNLRAVIKIYKYGLNYNSKIDNNEKHNFDYHNYPGVYQLQWLVDIAGGKDSLISMIESLKRFQPASRVNHYFGELFKILLNNNNMEFYKQAINYSINERHFVLLFSQSGDMKNLTIQSIREKLDGGDKLSSVELDTDFFKLVFKEVIRGLFG